MGFLAALCGVWWPWRQRASEGSSILCRAGNATCLPKSPFVPYGSPFRRWKFYFDIANMFSHDFEDDVLGVVKQRLASRADAGHDLVVLHIGTNSLREEAENYKRLASWGSTTMVFVEPLPEAFAKLRKNTVDVGSDGSRVELVNAAVCPDTSGNFTFYGYSEKIYEEFPDAPMWFLTMFSSLDKDQLVRVHRDHKHVGWWYTAEQWRSMESYIEAVPVRCVTPTSLFAELQLEPESLDFLVVDAEGYDVKLVDLFLALDRFRPAYLQFEWEHLDGQAEAFSETVSALAARGYDVHRGTRDMYCVLSDSTAPR